MKDSFAFRSAAIRESEPVIRNAEGAPFRVHGLFKSEDGLFARLPRSVAEQTNWRMPHLYTNTAGGRLRFATDSSFLALGAIYPPLTIPSERTAALSGACAVCFDLYTDGKHCRVLWHEALIQRGSGVSFDLSEGRYEAFIRFEEKKTRQITLCFPSFVNVSDLYVGLEKNAVLEEAKPYVNEHPVVFYGSSITQGACASRSGNTYPNLLSARFHFDYVNLGFASACKAEEPMIDHLCGMPMELLVFEYDHNAPDADFLRKTHLPALRKIRAAHPHVPIVLLSKPNVHTGKEEAIKRMRVIQESYEILRSESDAPIHFVNGQEILESRAPEMMTVDGTHPTDLGFYCMAEALSEVFKLYF